MSYEWMRKIINNGYMLTHIVSQVWKVELEGHIWTIATDGHHLVAVKGDVLDAAPCEAEKLGKVARFFKPTGGEAFVHVYAAFREWLDVSKVGVCPICLGSGRDENLDDEEIDNRINSGSSFRLGRLHGQLLNRTIAELAFANLSAESIEIRVRGDMEPVLIRSLDDAWRVLWMPVREDPRFDEEVCPIFPAQEVR